MSVSGESTSHGLPYFVYRNQLEALKLRRIYIIDPQTPNTSKLFLAAVEMVSNSMPALK